MKKDNKRKIESLNPNDLKDIFENISKELEKKGIKDSVAEFRDIEKEIEKGRKKRTKIMNEKIDKFLKIIKEKMNPSVELTKELNIKLGYADKYCLIGIKYSENGNYDKAIEYHQKAIDINPELYEAHFNMGLSFSNKGLYNEAIKCFQKAIEIKPDFDLAYGNMANIYYKKGNIDKAIECYQKAINIYSDNTKVMMGKGINRLLLKGKSFSRLRIWKKQLKNMKKLRSYIIKVHQNS